MKPNTNKGAIIIVILLGVVLFARIYKGHPHSNGYTSTTTPHQSVIDPGAPLIYTRHARCRMDCRHISEDDIREVLREGYVNEAKSQQNQTPCPTYAIEEDRHKDGVRLRIVFAKCDHETKVVTCIDRDHEYECDCK